MKVNAAGVQMKMVFDWVFNPFPFKCPTGKLNALSLLEFIFFPVLSRFCFQVFCRPIYFSNKLPNASVRDW